MSDRSTGFLAAHAARGNRSVLYLGLGLALVGAVLSLLFDNIYGLLLIASPGVVALAVWLRRRLDPTAHPVYKQLDRYGDRAQLTAEVEREFADAAIDEQPHLGARWLAVGDTYGVHLVPWRAVAWLHLVEHRQSGRVMGYKVRVWTTDPRTITTGLVRDREEQQGLLARLCERAPWAEVGYSPEQQKAWEKDRAAVLARVEARRQATAT